MQIKRLSDVNLPQYHSKGAAALDLPSAIDITIQPNEKVLIPTGLAMAIPKGHVGLVWDRSGLAAKHSITSLAGVIDADYRGEIKVVLINLSNQPYKISKNDRIAQLLIQPVIQVDIQEVDQLDETQRADAGFGSSGK